MQGGDGACDTAGRESVHGKGEQTNTGEQDMEGKEQAVKKTNIKERSL